MIRVRRNLKYVLGVACLGLFIGVTIEFYKMLKFYDCSLSGYICFSSFMLAIFCVMSAFYFDAFIKRDA